MERINLMWAYPDSVETMADNLTKITLKGNRRRQDGKPGQEVEIVIHDIYGIDCLIRMFVESENYRLEKAQEFHVGEKAVLADAVSSMDEWG
jgi:hypothetical protein